MPEQHEHHPPESHRSHHRQSAIGPRPTPPAEHHAAHSSHAGHDASAGHGGAQGHDRHEGHSVEMFRQRFWLALVLTLPTLAWGHMLAGLIGHVVPRFPGAEWIAPVFGTTVFFYGGSVFLVGAARELGDRLPGMMTLVSLAVSVAFGFSVAVTLGFPGMPLWEELASLVTIMLLGHWIEMRSISQAHGALRELSKLLPNVAVREVGDLEEEVPLSELRVRDHVLVRPGARVPTDGVVSSGRSQLNESMLTGESRPVEKAVGDAVIAGSINGAGSLRVEVTKTGTDTALARIMQLVAQAQQSRSRAQALADRAAFALTWIAITAAAITAIVWVALRADPAFVAERVVSVLVVACPHALGLAIPLVISISTTLAAQNGLLVRDRRGLEEARSLDAVIFDKTGTLTLGEHRVVELRAAEGVPQDEALRLAAGVERDSEHPVARAIVASATERRLTIPTAEDFRAIPGQGVEARVEGRRLLVGGPNLLSAMNVEPPPALRDAAAAAASRGQSAVYLVESEHATAVFAVADAIRPESPEATRRLHEAGIETVMLTGDARAVAESVAKALGITRVHAEVLPESKAQLVRSLKSGGKRVAMVGDGVNDAPALATADVAIAIGAGTDVAVEAGDVVLVRSDPRDVPRIIELSRATYRKMVQNLWWAAGYNIVAIPLAAGLLSRQGILLPPAVAAILMSASTVIVAINAQTLRRVRL